jgi:tRNA (guanine-N7-)-methyltransferase
MARQLKEYSRVMLNPEDLGGVIDFTRIFGRDNPVHVEIGSGKGTFLVHEAKADPDVDFLGIEWSRKFYLFAVDRIGRWGLRNVRITWAEAVAFLSDFVREESVDCFHIYFPDPWPKMRHHKRRLLQPDNVEIFVRRLKPGGTLRIATDHREYFEQILEVTSAYRTKLEEIEFPRPAGAEEGEYTGTNYERKYIKDGRPIYTLAFRKRAEPAPT